MLTTIGPLTASQIATFVPAALALLVVPGPSVLFVVGRGVALGRRAAIETVIGNTLGAMVQIALVAAGVGALLARSQILFTVMKLAGAAYLVVLGVRAIRDRHAVASSLEAVVPRSSTRIIREGFLVGVTNPKVTLFFLAVLPQFVDADRGEVPLQLVALGLLFALLALVNDGLYGLAAGSVRSWLDRKPRALAALGGTGGVLMIGLGVRLALTGRRD